MESVKLAGAAAKGFAPAVIKLASVLRVRLQKSHISALQSSMKASATVALAEPLSRADDHLQQQIAAFLESPGFSDACYQVLLVEAAGSTLFSEAHLRDLLSRQLRFYVDDAHSQAWATYIGATVMQATSSLIRAVAFRSLLSDVRLQAEAHNRFVEQLLDGIGHRLQLIANVADRLTSTEIEIFEKKYRSQVQARYRKITPPNFGTPRSVPFSKVYVAPTLVCGVDKTTLGDFITAIHRTVVVGDPGGGKTTLATRIILDATTSTGLYGRGGSLTPFVVTLRDYAARKQTKPMSIVAFIEETIRARFQMEDVPPDVVEFLLATGRGIVIFDGLDELLDTTKRQETVDDVELFCSLYSTTPTLVTSRAVGYDEAPLDRDLFQVFKLAQFQQPQIKEYVQKWFANSPDLAADERTALSQRFLEESKAVADLAANPLMLSLMCNLYRGERYIPRNRPELYEKCATMLFERWDKSRKIIVPLPIEAHVRPAMMAIAFQIFETPALQEGVPRSELEAMAASYLLSAKYDDEVRARTVAAKFIDFCTGRAWVFTNTGSSGVEELYQFTHRTFLEYFAAAHLARTRRTPAELLEVLLPHIGLAEWDVVSQLAVQMMSKQLDRAADEIIELALQYQTPLTGNRKCNVLSFSVRCLAFLVPRESTVRQLVGALLRAALDEDVFTDRPMARASSPIGHISPIDLLSNLFHVVEENQEPALDALRTELGDALLARNETALDLCCTGLGSQARPGAARSAFDPHWVSAVCGVVESAGDRLVTTRDSRLLSRRFGCVFAFERRGISAKELVSRHGVEQCFIPIRNLSIKGLSAPEAFLFMEEANERWADWGLAMLDAISATEPPWFAVNNVIDPFGDLLERRLDVTRARKLGAIDLRGELAKVVISAAAFEALALFSEGFDPLLSLDQRSSTRSVPNGLLVFVEDSAPAMDEARDLRRPATSLLRGRRRALDALNSMISMVDRIGTAPAGLDVPYQAVRECLYRWSELLQRRRLSKPMDSRDLR